MDSIEFYSDNTITEWIMEFQKEENQLRFFLPNIPFSYAEIAREWIRRDNCKP
jgi:hypothetical protein